MRRVTSKDADDQVLRVHRNDDSALRVRCRKVYEFREDYLLCVVFFLQTLVGATQRTMSSIRWQRLSIVALLLRMTFLHIHVCDISLTKHCRYIRR